MRICVIGAGASGLAAAKKLVDQGLAPTVYERDLRRLLRLTGGREKAA